MQAGKLFKDIYYGYHLLAKEDVVAWVHIALLKLQNTLNFVFIMLKVRANVTHTIDIKASPRAADIPARRVHTKNRSVEYGHKLIEIMYRRIVHVVSNY